MFEMIRADIARKKEKYYGRKSWLSRNLFVFLQPGTIAVIVYRFGRWVFLMKVPVLKQILMMIYLPIKVMVVICFGITIPVRSDIGPGFVIHCFNGIFIARNKFGKNLTVNQEVTIGGIRQEGQPVVGDNVFFGAGAKVLGNIKIGNNVIVGANSLVVRDVPDNCTVLGVPAQVVIRRGAPKRAETAEDQVTS
jgi:serine O-acetyltransferase